MKNKLLLLSAVICLSGFACANANLTLTDITSPKNPAYRVGISEVPENPYVQSATKAETLEQTIQKQTAQNNDEANYADLNIKRLSKEIAYDLECEEQEMVGDLSLLWQGAAMQSDTINFALYKLANPDADKPNKSTVKNMLKTIASMSTLVGAGISNPLLAGTSLIGSNVLGIMTQDTKALNYKYSKVNDADMIILIRKVEDLQQKTVDLYYDYMNSKKQLDMVTKLATERKQRFELAQKNNVSKELIVITDAYFRTAVDKQKTARSEFLSKRAALEQFVGNEAFSQFEQELALREGSQNGEAAQTKEDYDNTISNVTNYTNNLSDSKTASLSGIGYTDDDPNLSKLPPLEPTPLAQEQKVEQEIEQQTEQLAKEVDEAAQEVNNKKDKKSKKIKKERVKKEKVKEEKPKKIKRDPYDTKGLIFLHDKQPDESNYTDNSAQNQPVSNEKIKKERVKKEKKVKEVSQKLEKIDNEEIIAPEKQNQKGKMYHGVELLPLDEIKAPDLKPNGYSIFYK